MTVCAHAAARMPMDLDLRQRLPRRPAEPGRSVPDTMMLTAEIEEALGKSILTILRGPCPAAGVDPVGACVASASGISGALQAAA